MCLLTWMRNNENSDISVYLSLLWKYSYYNTKYKIDAHEQEVYLNNLLHNLKNKIENEWDKIRENIPDNLMNKFLTINDEVINDGLYLAETKLNSIIMEYINFATTED